MDIEKIFGFCLSGPKDVAASDIAQASEQPFAVWCRFFAPPEMRDPIGDYEKLLFRLGKEHETRFIKEAYPGAERLEFETYEEGFKIALRSMVMGANVITNVPLFYLPDGIFGVVDVIERVDEGKSIFGEYHYIPKEIKLATNIKEKHLLQTAFYSLLLGKIQKYVPNHFIIVNGENEASKYRFSDYEQMLKDDIQLFRDIRAGKVKPTPTYNGCGWPWESYTNTEAERTMDMSLICKEANETRKHKKIKPAPFQITEKKK
ncbi:MAG: hypothetical protein NTY20_01425 [Candidatus Aenigmarchaeota archaeon]|nr:hypothetical protein [Candidatus Aenigmarchaeota archaeon]